MSINANTGRSIVMALVFVGAMVAIGTLFFVGRDGAISIDNELVVLKSFVGLYLPLLSPMATFYFTERLSEKTVVGQTSSQALVFAGVVIAVWVFIPAAAIGFSPSYNSALEVIGIFRGYGDAIALAAITFYFAKSSPT